MFARSFIAAVTLSAALPALAQISTQAPIQTIPQSQAVTVVNTDDQPANVRLAQEPYQMNVVVGLYSSASASNVSSNIPAGYRFISQMASVRMRVPAGEVPELWITGFLGWVQAMHYVALSYQGRTNGYDMYYATVPLMVSADGGYFIRVNASRTTASAGNSLATVQLSGYLTKI